MSARFTFFPAMMIALAGAFICGMPTTAYASSGADTPVQFSKVRLGMTTKEVAMLLGEGGLGSGGGPRNEQWEDVYYRSGGISFVNDHVTKISPAK